jgi:ribonuclease BN (tRNA processing enzyme)
VFVSHLHADHFGGLPFLILDGQFTRRTRPLTVAGPPGLARRLPDAMELYFPGSASVTRRFPVEVVELAPGTTSDVAGLPVTAFEADHPSGAPSLSLRLTLAGRTVAYTGDTAWTPVLPAVAAAADLFIAEAYSFTRPIPYHLSHTDLVAHQPGLTCRRIVLTHPGPDMLAHHAESVFDLAHDGLTLEL